MQKLKLLQVISCYDFLKHQPVKFQKNIRCWRFFSKFSKFEVLYNEVKILILSDGIFTFSGIGAYKVTGVKLRHDFVIIVR